MSSAAGHVDVGATSPQQPLDMPSASGAVHGEAVKSRSRYRFPSPDWFEMQREEIIKALDHAVFSEDFRFTLVERFHGVGHLENGLIRGFRVEIRGSEVAFYEGVGPDERGDATIDMTAKALDELIHLPRGDPAQADAVERLLQSGDLVRAGRWDALEHVSAEVHQSLYERSA